MTTFVKGDHIVSPTKWPRVTHHGIVCSNGKIVHFDGHSKKVSMCQQLEDFSKPFDIDQIRKVTYSKSLHTDETVKEALKFLKREVPYDLVTRNCEHFAVFCKTGEWTSKQVSSFFEVNSIKWLTNLCYGQGEFRDKRNKTLVKAIVGGVSMSVKKGTRKPGLAFVGITALTSGVLYGVAQLRNKHEGSQVFSSNMKNQLSKNLKTWRKGQIVFTQDEDNNVTRELFIGNGTCITLDD